MPFYSRFISIVSLIREAFRGYGRVFAITTVLGIVGGILGGIGIGALIPLFAYFTGNTTFAGGKISTLITETFTAIGIHPSALVLVIFIVLLLSAKAVVVFWTSQYGERMAADYEENARKEIFAALMHAKWSYLLKQKTGHLQRVIMDDTTYAGQVLFESSALILAGTSLIIYLAVAFVISPTVTLITLIPGALLFLALKRVFYRVRQLSQVTIETDKEMNHYIGEHLTGAKTVKALGADDGTLPEAFKKFENLTGWRMRIVFFRLLSSAFFEPVSFILIGLVFLVSYHSAGFDFGAFAATIYLIQKIFAYLQTIQAKLQGVSRYVPNLRNIMGYRSLLKKEVEINTGTLPFSFKKSLEFKNVSFAYGETRVFDDMSISFPKGEVTALIGSSGSGKTTLTDLLLRLFAPSEGSIEIDGIDISKINMKAWREHVGYVSQDVFLLNDTIENNIRFYDESVSEENITLAAKQANILKTVQEMPQGFKTLVGERGVELSGGQRQRIALARVLAKKPDILILDEATSALDNESERLIQETLESLRGKITIIMVAHRISTVQNADMIIALDNGKIVEKGAPQELLQKDSYFKKMTLMASEK